MTTMLDKMSRAIVEAGFPAERMSMDEAEVLARAALQAIREPTDVTINAAWAKADIDDAVTPEEAWPAMIDAILEEKPE